MRNSYVASMNYDDQTQLQLARQDALLAAANAAVVWARHQCSARPALAGMIQIARRL